MSRFVRMRFQSSAPLLRIPLTAVAALAWLAGVAWADPSAPADTETGGDAGTAAAADADADADTDADALAAYFRENHVYDGPDVRQRLVEGRRAFRRAEFAAAKHAYATAAALSPEHVIVLHLLGLAHVALEEPAEAARVWRRALALFPGWMRLAFDVAAEFGEHHAVLDTRLQALRRTVDAADDAAATATDDNAAAAVPPGAAAERFALAYLLFYDGQFEAALALFHALTQHNTTDAVAAGFVRVLAQAGFAVPTPEPPRAFALPAAKRWLLPGLRALGGRRYGQAALAFGEAGMREAHGEPFAWMAVALIGDNRPDHAARMLARAVVLGRPGLTAMPQATDLLPRTLLTERRRAWSREPVPAARRLLLGFLAFLDGQAGEARDHLHVLARPVGEREVGWEAPARALLERLPERGNPPRLDLAALSAELDAQGAEPSPQLGRVPGAGAGADEDAGAGADEEHGAAVTRSGPGVRQPGADEGTTAAEPLSLSDVRARMRSEMEQGDRALRGGDFAVALARYAAAYELGEGFSPTFYDNPLHVDVLLKLSRAHFGLGRYAEATTAVQRYLQASPEAIRRQLSGYPAIFDERDFEQGVLRLDRHVNNEPADAQARFLLAYIRYTQADYSQAYAHFALLLVPAAGGEAPHPLVAYYVELLEAPPIEAHRANDQTATAERLREQGRRLLAERAYDRAEPLLRRAYGIAAEPATVTVLLAAIWGQAAEAPLAERIAHYSDMAQTLRSFLRGLDEDGWRAVSLDFRAAFGTAVAYERARQALEQHVSERTLDFEALYVLGFVHVFAEEYAQAVQVLARYERSRRGGEPGPEFTWFLERARRRQAE